MTPVKMRAALSLYHHIMVSHPELRSPPQTREFRLFIGEFKLKLLFIGKPVSAISMLLVIHWASYQFKPHGYVKSFQVLIFKALYKEKVLSHTVMFFTHSHSCGHFLNPSKHFSLTYVAFPRSDFEQLQLINRFCLFEASVFQKSIFYWTGLLKSLY